jgi:hypothetical protein
MIPLFKIKYKNHIFVFQKIIKINMYIVNDITYKQAKFHYKILYIVGYTKITNSDKNVDLKLYMLRSTYLSFLCSPKYKSLEHDF